MVTGNAFIDRFGENWMQETLAGFRRLHRLNKTKIDTAVLQGLFAYEKRKWEAEQQRLRELEEQQREAEKED